MSSMTRAINNGSKAFGRGYFRNRMTGGDVLNYSLIALFSLICLFPFLYVISVSFTSPDEYQPLKFIIWPQHFSLAAYEYIITGSAFVSCLKNSVYVTLVGTLCNLFVTFTGAYGLSKSTMPGQKLFVSLITFTLVFNAGIVPNFLLIKDIGLINNMPWALILPGLTNAWSLLVVRSFMASISTELEEAAKIDGCNDLGVFFRIIIPLSKASIATFAIMFMVGHWNAYFNAMIYMTSGDHWTLPLFIKSLIIDNADMGFGVNMTDEKQVPQETIKMAAIVLSMLPIMFSYPFLQQYFEKGVMLGSVKG